MVSREHGKGSGLAVRAAVAGVLLGAAAGAAAGASAALLPRAGAVARGVRIAGTAVAEGEPVAAAIARRASTLLARRVVIRHAETTVVDATLAELGAEIDVATAERLALSVGRRGGLLDRLDAAGRARRGLVDVPLFVAIPVERLAERIARLKEERDERPVGARLDVRTRTATPHAPGRYLDAYGALAAIDAALGASDVGRVPERPIAVELPVLEVAPRASTDVVAAIDVSAVVSRYKTRYGFAGGQAGRAQNIARAAQGIDGLVLMPGEVVSFNAAVGPRSEENGFAPAPEIYKGEMREGIGGGTCQVASTLHAAAFFGGIDVVERSHHSRPSGYIGIGLDATVVFPSVDLRLRNPFDFPIVVHAEANEGLLAVELLGRVRPATVELATATTGVAKYKRKIEEAPWLPEGRIVLKQRGIRGYSIRKTRTLRSLDGTERVEITTDVYPPTLEVYLVPPGTDPASLPPLPDEEASASRDAIYDGSG